jgi:hypothetical protein
MMAITKILAGGVAFAALASAAPAAAQYYPGYGYGNPYGGNVVGQVLNNVLGGGYGYGANSQAVVNQCAGAVQARLGGYGGYGYGGGRVLGISQVSPRNDGGIAVRGVATSGRYAGYGYGGQTPDLTFRCRTDYRGFIREVTINRTEPGYGYGYGYTPYNNYDYSQYGYRRY